MPPRTRTRGVTVFGSFKPSGGTWGVNNRNYASLKEECSDSVGNPTGDNAFSCEKIRVSGSIVNGAGIGILPGWDNCLTSAFQCNVPIPNYLDLGSSAPEWNRVLAVTNPSRPDILLPAFLAELRDLPKMIKYGVEAAKFLIDADFRRVITGSHRFKKDYMDAGRLVHYLKPTRGNYINLAHQIGMANLALQFGFLPLFGDLAKMLTFQEAVDKRRKEMDRLYDGRGLKRRVDVGSNQSHNKVLYRVETAYGPIGSVDVTAVRQVRRWATVRYRPKSKSSLPPSDQDLRKMLTGLSIHSIGQIGWELLPWSWLADYFGNVGQTLAAQNNHAQVQTPRGCIMTTSSETLSHSGGYWADICSISSGQRKSTIKLRAVYAGISSPTFGLPILGNRQLSILGSIYATRAFSK